MKKMLADTEVALILIGQLPFVLDHQQPQQQQQQPLVGFFRLQTAVLLDEMSEVAFPVRFIFVYLSSMTVPIQALENYGRAVAMLITDKVSTNLKVKVINISSIVEVVVLKLRQVALQSPGSRTC